MNHFTRLATVLAATCNIVACGALEQASESLQMPRAEITGVPVDEARVQAVYQAVTAAARDAALPGVSTVLPQVALDVTADRIVGKSGKRAVGALTVSQLTGYVEITVALIDTDNGRVTTDIARTDLCYQLVRLLAHDLDGSRAGDPALYFAPGSLEARCRLAGTK